MCFVCFCVFHSDTPQHITTHVFYVFLCFSSKQTLGHNQCVLRVFCNEQIFKFYFKPGQTPNVFYVFLCFSCKQITGHNSCVLRIFVFFLIQNYQKRFSRTRQNATLVFYVFLCFSSKNFRSQPVCFMCFCVFSKQNLGHNPCVLRVSVIFYVQI